MESISQAEWEVLNSTADDRENLERIYRMVSRQSQARDVKELPQRIS